MNVKLNLFYELNLNCSVNFIIYKYLLEEQPNDHFLLRFPLHSRQRLLDLGPTIRCENCSML